MARAAEKNGVRYVCGRAGQAVKLTYDQDGTCTGVVTADGKLHTADLVVLSAGAQIAALVEASDEVEASASAVAVIQLTPEEVEKYRDIPIQDDFEQGGFERLLKSESPIMTDGHRDHLSARREWFVESLQLSFCDELQEQILPWLVGGGLPWCSSP